MNNTVTNKRAEDCRECNRLVDIGEGYLMMEKLPGRFTRFYVLCTECAPKLANEPPWPTKQWHRFMSDRIALRQQGIDPDACDLCSRSFDHTHCTDCGSIKHGAAYCDMMRY